MSLDPHLQIREIMDSMLEEVIRDCDVDTLKGTAWPVSRACHTVTRGAVTIELQPASVRPSTGRSRL